MHDLYIVTPARNVSRTMDATIWSIVSQTGGLAIRYHVQDGASTDDTVEKLAAWARRIEAMRDMLPSRVTFSYASAPDGGMYDAIAKGFAAVEIPDTAYMGWCNGDDALWPGALEAVAGLAKALPMVDWITGWRTAFDNLGRLADISHRYRYPQSVLAGGLSDGIHWPFLQQESTFWRKRLWDSVKGLDTKMRLAGDWDLWRRFAGVSRLAHVQRQLGAFWLRPGQQSANIAAYRAEMDAVAPAAARHARFHALLRNGALGRPVLLAKQAADGRWLCHESGKARKSLAKSQVLRWLPTPMVVRMKFHEGLW